MRQWPPVNLFTDQGMIVQTKGRDGQLLERHEASGSAQFASLKVILIDAESASASEIVAGALRELHGAVLVGTESSENGQYSDVCLRRQERTQAHHRPLRDRGECCT